jgi:hypothetical protein
MLFGSLDRFLIRHLRRLSAQFNTGGVLIPLYPIAKLENVGSNGRDLEFLFYGECFIKKILRSAPC